MVNGLYLSLLWPKINRLAYPWKAWNMILPKYGYLVKNIPMLRYLELKAYKYNFYQRSCWKVMFSQMWVSHSVHGGYIHPTVQWSGVHPSHNTMERGCMQGVAFKGDVPPMEVCTTHQEYAPPYQKYAPPGSMYQTTDGSTGGRYASCWNAFLSYIFLR